MFPDLTRLQLSIGSPGAEHRSGRSAKRQRTANLLQPGQALCRYARNRAPVPDPIPELAALPPVSEDPFLEKYKMAAQEAIGKILTGKAFFAMDDDTVAETRRVVQQIISDTSSWQRQDYGNLSRGTAVELEGQHSEELVRALRNDVRVPTIDSGGTVADESYDPSWTFKVYRRNNRLISQQLVDNAESFFAGMVQGFNQASPCVEQGKPYVIHYRFDTTSFKATDVFHMDALWNTREYGHQKQGADPPFFAPLDSYTVSFCYDDALDKFECGTEVLLGVPTLTPTAMLQLSHVNGGMLQPAQLKLLWGNSATIAPEVGENAEWRKSAWQLLANAMQKCTESVVAEAGVEALLETECYILHKVKTNVLSDYAHYVFHRADATSADPARSDVRCFANIGQGREEQNTDYYEKTITLNTGTEATIKVAWN
jgi:hypothetical protein